jgi:hypothetical protein
VLDAGQHQMSGVHMETVTFMDLRYEVLHQLIV